MCIRDRCEQFIVEEYCAKRSRGSNNAEWSKRASSCGGSVVLRRVKRGAANIKPFVVVINNNSGALGPAGPTLRRWGGWRTPSAREKVPETGGSEEETIRTEQEQANTVVEESARRGLERSTGFMRETE